MIVVYQTYTTTNIRKFVPTNHPYNENSTFKGNSPIASTDFASILRYFESFFITVAIIAKGLKIAKICVFEQNRALRTKNL